MNQDYNFERVGKKMPFTMPDDFFDKVQANVLAEVAKEEKMKQAKHHKAKVVRLFLAVASMAACVCFAVLVGRSVMGTDTKAQHPVASVASVDKAYENLSADEQQELNATYANDVYLCME